MSSPVSVSWSVISPFLIYCLYHLFTHTFSAHYLPLHPLAPYICTHFTPNLHTQPALLAIYVVVFCIVVFSPIHSVFSVPCPLPRTPLLSLRVIWLENFGISLPSPHLPPPATPHMACIFFLYCTAHTHTAPLSSTTHLTFYCTPFYTHTCCTHTPPLHTCCSLLSHTYSLTHLLHTAYTAFQCTHTHTTLLLFTHHHHHCLPLPTHTHHPLHSVGFG